MSTIPLNERPLAEQVALLDPDEFAAYVAQEEADGWPDARWASALRDELRRRENGLAPELRELPA